VPVSGQEAKAADRPGPSAGAAPAVGGSHRMWIVLPVHNRIESTRRLLACLGAQTFTDFTLVVVDDGSTDGTADYLRQAAPDAVVLPGNGHLWWGGALDKAYRYLRRVAGPDDVALILNNDVTFDADFLESAWARVAPASGELVLAACYDQRTGRPLARGHRSDWATFTFPAAEGPEQVAVLSTRGLFLKVGDWCRIGGFHPWLLPHYLSDFEFTIRAQRMGFRLACDEGLKVHLDVETSGKRGLAVTPLRQLYRSLFDLRYVMSLRHWIPFVLLAAEPGTRLRGIRKVLRRFVGGMIASYRQWRGGGAATDARRTK